MVTAVISDLHLGARSGRDLLSRPDVRRRLLAALETADQLVLLGDTIELRGPLAHALAAAAPFFEDLGRVMAGRRVTLVPGNHDHGLGAPWLGRRGGSPLRLAELTTPTPGDPIAGLAGRMGDTPLALAYPGVWLRRDVYATHGHYLDCHNQVRTFECMARAVVERVAGAPRGGYRAPDDYEAVLAPIYRAIDRVAQSRRIQPVAVAARAAVRSWERLNGYGGPRRRPGVHAMAEVVRCLGVEAAYVLFGHLHAAGSWSMEGTPTLVNTGSWVEGESAGVCVLVGANGAPELKRLL